LSVLWKDRTIKESWKTCTRQLTWFAECTRQLTWIAGMCGPTNSFENSCCCLEKHSFFLTLTGKPLS